MVHSNRWRSHRSVKQGTTESCSEVSRPIWWPRTKRSCGFHQVPHRDQWLGPIRHHLAQAEQIWPGPELDARPALWQGWEYGRQECWSCHPDNRKVQTGLISPLCTTLPPSGCSQSTWQPACGNMMGVVRWTGTFFAVHPKRQLLLEKAINKTQPESNKKKLGDLSRTRWVQRLDNLETFQMLHPLIVASMETICADGSKEWLIQTPWLILRARCLPSLSMISSLLWLWPTGAWEMCGASHPVCSLKPRISCKQLKKLMLFLHLWTN